MSENEINFIKQGQWVGTRKTRLPVMAHQCPGAEDVANAAPLLEAARTVGERSVNLNNIHAAKTRGRPVLGSMPSGDGGDFLPAMLWESLPADGPAFTLGGELLTEEEAATIRSIIDAAHARALASAEEEYRAAVTALMAHGDTPC